MITHYDLFAGIGGFSIALEEVFSDRTIEHIFCEWERFPAAVLKRQWPEAEYWGDIAELVTHTERPRLEGDRSKPERPGRLSERGGAGQDETPDWTIITGGFPCQPFSAAGRRKGTADDRYQWPNMFAVIRNVRPDWIIAENVRGLVTWSDGLVLEQVCADLESEGYEVQPLIIPAVAVGAPHRRDRVWIIGTLTDDTKAQRWNDGDTKHKRSQSRKEHIHSNSGNDSWAKDWREIAFATCNDSVDDGLSRTVDGVSYSRAKWRKESLKAYGNAIVPQVAMQIFKGIRASYEPI